MSRTHISVLCSAIFQTVHSNIVVLIDAPNSGSSVSYDMKRGKSRMRYFKLFGVDLSPDNIAVAIVYFVQGVLGLARLAVSFYLKDDLRLDPAEVLTYLEKKRQFSCSFTAQSYLLECFDPLSLSKILGLSASVV